jgi:CAP12/Pycsar effector protein, TIR domain
MRVAALGSWRTQDQAEWKLKGSPAAFRKAAWRVGEELAKRGHSLIVGSDSRHTADRHAVDGALSVLDRASDAPRILVIRPRSTRERLSFDEARRSRPGLFVEEEVETTTWASVKVFQTKQADAVVLLGGAEKTQQAGLTAAVSGKPLACIGSFGGAARMLNELFLRSPTKWGYDDESETKLRQLQEPFSDVLLDSALSVAWIEGAPKLLLIHGRSSDRDLLKTYLSNELKVGQVIVLADKFAPTQPIPLKFERYARSVDGAIALVTPDDIGGLAVSPEEAAPRARQNVWIEVGWFWGRRGRSKLLLLRKGMAEIPSDLGNVENYEYTQSPLESGTRDKIRQFVEELRFPEGSKRDS